MQFLTCREIIEATGGVLATGDAGFRFKGVSTDSRNIPEGTLFIPLTGQNFDGHDFIPDALSRGAAGSLTRREPCEYEGKIIIRVADTQKALQDIAAFYRRKFHIPFVGITGSVGKTSTKDMIACVLARKYNVLKTEGNFNNEIGLPLTLLKLDKSHEAAVVEMGMSGFGELSRLTAIAKPDIAVITNIGLSHIEKLGSRQNILKAKMEILEGLDRKGHVVLNGDDNLLYGLKDLLSFRTVFYGMEEGLDYQAFNVTSEGEQGTSFGITLAHSDRYVRIPAPGIHHIYNALAAIAVGMELGVPVDEIVSGISDFHPGKMRLSILSHKGCRIVNDAYNASPQSMEAAIRVLADVGKGGRTVAVLGDMLELGDISEKAHMDVGKFAFSRGVDYIITVGAGGRNIARGALSAGAHPEQIRSFESNGEAGDFTAELMKTGDSILVKGSRGMKMEEIVNRLINNS